MTSNHYALSGNAIDNGVYQTRVAPNSNHGYNEYIPSGYIPNGYIPSGYIEAGHIEAGRIYTSNVSDYQLDIVTKDPDPGCPRCLGSGIAAIVEECKVGESYPACECTRIANQLILNDGFTITKFDWQNFRAGDTITLEQTFTIS